MRIYNTVAVITDLQKVRHLYIVYVFSVHCVCIFWINHRLTTNLTARMFVNEITKLRHAKIVNNTVYMNIVYQYKLLSQIIGGV